ncbi:MAG: tRNA(Ile)-lysidine synthase [Chloroflexota bacterium]|nr:tRNA lysidine(34) synthetase TilS [Ardenticatenaceae bacterium]GIK58949.1 MAG: tRNA(Ile)-lysidine synthase [Chloroflexota bacterium]
MEPHELERQVAAQCQAVVPPEARLVVGVSGGPDSLALLFVLAEVLGAERVIAAHLNHSLRPEADEELLFVVKTAVTWHLPIVVDKVDVPALAQANGWSVEEAARHARYRFLAETAVQEATPFVAVAHHADDQAETVLLHLIRGSGLAGLRGMLPVSPLPGAPELTLLRPLLSVPRRDIEAYCAAHQLQPVYDQSNADTTYLRNRIRHELLPLLAQYNPQISVHLQQLAAITAADYALLAEWFQPFWQSMYVEQGDGWLALARARWRELPLSHRRLALRWAMLALRPSQTDISFQVVELARELVERGVTGSQMDLPGGLRLRLEYERILLVNDVADKSLPFGPQLPTAEAVELWIPGQMAMGGGWWLYAQEYVGDMAVIAQNSDPWVAFVDVGERESLTMRPRLTGERFQPLGLHGRHATVKEVMINRKVAQGLRPLWPIVAHEEHLVWLVGHQVDERVRVTAVSARIIRLTCRRVGVV